MSTSTAPIRLVDFVEDANLNEVRWNQTFLDEVKKEYGLRHGQGVVYCNVAQDRFRLVVCFYNIAVLVLPPVDPEQKHSLYLKVSEFLRQFASAKKITKRLEAEGELAASRIERRKKIAANERKRRRKR
jgi:hypothetical protein